MAWADTQNPEDIELAKRAVEAACQHPEQFDMSDWVCGTSMCIGGWMCYLDTVSSEMKIPTAGEVGVWLCSKGLTLDANWLHLFCSSKWPDQFFPPKHTLTQSNTTPELLRDRFAYWLETGL